MSRVSDAMVATRNSLPVPSEAVRHALAPTGVLRAGINLSNFLLVTGESADGIPDGVSPGMATALGELIGCAVEYRTFPSPGALADAAEENVWDIGNIGAEPARAEFITFTDAYCEIESTCLLPAGSPIAAFADVDRPGIRIAAKARAAYTLWLERQLRHASLRLFASNDAAVEGFVEQKLEVLAGLKPRLLEDQQQLPGSRLLAEKFTAVQQAIGTPTARGPTGAAFLQAFVAAAKASGLVQALIDHHGVTAQLAVAR